MEFSASIVIMSPRPKSLKQYIGSKYGEKLQTSVNTYGKELNRAARLANHHFNILCYKVRLVPHSLSPYKTHTPVMFNKLVQASVAHSECLTREVSV